MIGAAPVPLEPRGRRLAGGDLPGDDDLERPLAEVDPGDFCKRIRQLVGREAVEPVALPVEFFLEGDYQPTVRMPCCRRLLEHVAVAGPRGVDRGRVGDRGGAGEGVFDLVGQAEEVGRGGEPLRHLGMGGPADALILVGLGAVDHGGEREALRGPELLAEFEGVGRGRLPGEHVVGDCAEREHVDLLRRGGGVEPHLGGLVDRHAAVGERLDVGGPVARRRGPWWRAGRGSRSAS